MPKLEFTLKHPETNDKDNFFWKPASSWISYTDALKEKVTIIDGIKGEIYYKQSENPSLNKRYGEIILYKNYKKFAVFKVAQRGKPFLTFNGTAETYTLNIDGKEHIYIADDSSVNDSDPIICKIEMHNIVAEDNTHNGGIYHDDIYFDKKIFNSKTNNWIRPLGYNSIIDNYIDEPSELFEQPQPTEPSEETPISNITSESETNIDYNNDEDYDDSFYTLHIEEEGFIYKLGFNVQRNLTGEPREIKIEFYNRYPVLDIEYNTQISEDKLEGATFNNKIIGTLTIKQDPYIEFLIDSVETNSYNIRAVELNDYEYYDYHTESDENGNTNTTLRKIDNNSYLGEINHEFNPVIKVYNDETTNTNSGLLSIEKTDNGFLVRHLGIDVTEKADIQLSDDQKTVTVSYTISEDNNITETFNINNEETQQPIDIERIPNSIYHRTYKQLDNVLNYRVAGCFNQYIKLSTDADWITIKNIDYLNKKIYYQVSENTSEDEREAIINVSFYGGNTTTFTIKQFGQPSLIFEQSGSNILDYWVSKTGTSKIEGDEFLEYSLPIKEMKNIIPELLYSIDISINDGEYPNQPTVIEDIIGYETVTPNYKHDANASNSINISYNEYTKFVALSSRKSSNDEHIISGENTTISPPIINALTPTNNTDANLYNICQHMCVVELLYYTEQETEDGTENTPTYITNVSDSLILTTNDNLTKKVIDETVKLIYNDRNIANINLKQYDFDFIFIDPIELNVNYNTCTYHLHYLSDNSNYLRFRLLNEESVNTAPIISYFATNDINPTIIRFYNINESNNDYDAAAVAAQEAADEAKQAAKDAQEAADNGTGSQEAADIAKAAAKYAQEVAERAKEAAKGIYAVKYFTKSTIADDCQHNSAIDPTKPFPSIIVNILENPDTSVRGWNIAVDCAPDDSFSKVLTYVISIEQSGKLTMEILRNELNKCISFNKYVKEIEFGIYNVDGNSITFSSTPPYKITTNDGKELLSCDTVTQHMCIFENKYSQLNYNKEFNTYSFRCVSRITIPENKDTNPVLHNFDYYCPLM